MKNTQKFIFLFCFAALFTTINMVHAQSQSKPLIAVEATAKNVLYMGVNNPVNIAVDGIKSSEIKVSVTQGVIEGRDGKYIVRAEKPGKLTFNINQGEKLLGSKDFRVLALPDPLAVLLNSDGSIAMKAGSASMELRKLVKVKDIGADLDDFLFDVQFKVISFQMKTTMKGIIKIIQSSSSELTEEMHQQIKMLRQGESVTFEDIKALGPDGTTRKLNPIVVKIM